MRKWPWPALGVVVVVPVAAAFAYLALIGVPSEGPFEIGGAGLGFDSPSGGTFVVGHAAVVYKGSGEAKIVSAELIGGPDYERTLPVRIVVVPRDSRRQLYPMSGPAAFPGLDREPTRDAVVPHDAYVQFVVGVRATAKAGSVVRLRGLNVVARAGLVRYRYFVPVTTEVKLT